MAKTKHRLRRSNRYESPEACRIELGRCGYVDAFASPGWPQKWQRTGEREAWAIARPTRARCWIITEYPKEEPGCMYINGVAVRSSSADEKEPSSDSGQPSSTLHEPYVWATQVPTLRGSVLETEKSID